MRYRDYSPISETEGQLTFPDRIKGMLKFGFAWPNEMQAQRIVVNFLKRSLDNRFTLLRNLLLPEANITLPLLLIGPPGVILINPTPVQGVFSAKEGTWLVNTARGYQPSAPNWMQRTQLLAKAVNVFLERNNFLLVDAEGVLVFTNPGTHVDTNRPVVRILLADALPRFTAGLLKEAPVLSGEDAYNLVRTLTRSAEAQEELSEPETVPDRAVQEKRRPAGASQFEQALKPIEKTFNFNRKQWVILAILSAVVVIVLLVFLVFILFLM